MSGSSKCPHPGPWEYRISTMIAEDTGRALLQVKAARCPHCGQRWRFEGVSSEKDPFAPTANRDATMLVLPMVEI